MGGDNAPRVEVEGVVQALRELPPTFRIQLVGRTADVEAALQAHGNVDRKRLDIVEAPEVVGMGEKPLAAIKSKPRSSIAVGLGLQKQGQSDAFISAGNTGAVMAAATLLLRVHEGVARAAIGTAFPTAGQPVLVIDGGANVDCDARELVGCAGFVGNAILKFYESAGRMFAGMLQQALPDVLGRSEVKQLFKFLDYSEYGGAPLLGVKGVAIICHGASLARAIMHAVRVAAQMVESHLDQDIGAEFAEGGTVR